ncbi:MAG TPA: beta-N-acetylhexosaminidase [Caulobacteraceae bacterium]|jgi:beta-N-acetylhexosaminidase|nr:beta-N-acetylhexosaminidase [Caulobacteraceae bacterium]
MTLACIFGLAGPELNDEERAFFRECDPWGFIVFKRNVGHPAQLAALTAELRGLVGRADAPVLIDQEGGRVQRLGPPHWPSYPPGAAYRLAGADPSESRLLARLGGRLIAADLHRVGIDVDCAPVLDTPSPGAHDIIGDRAYAEEPEEVAALGRAFAEGLIAGGVLPVIKHIPGHGRAAADSHESLPVVDASAADLERDFAPFRVLSDMPLAMTAHVVFTAFDADRPATTSARVVEDVIRGSLGFSGALMSDDLSMKALAGSLRSRAEASHAAGCDLVLHCNGDAAQMKMVAAGARKLSGLAASRASAALARKPMAVEGFDEQAARAQLQAALDRLA